jgi:hypothetical protein
MNMAVPFSYSRSKSVWVVTTTKLVRAAEAAPCRVVRARHTRGRVDVTPHGMGVSGMVLIGVVRAYHDACGLKFDADQRCIV